MAANSKLDLYDNVYGDFASRAETAVRRAAFGDDIGQSSWLTAQDWLRFADEAGVHEASRVLEGIEPSRSGQQGGQHLFRRGGPHGCGTGVARR